ncbi:Penicillin-binding protein activator LpoA [Hydrogenovibrio crunogenus]|uniref:Penicillin-binding protein activator LpoA n=1 Tax=Hydrogenovibrio crunogenus TaxID=39765 RepID=A0A4V1C8Y4_9GAMM|nr:penicillin-binding protein activator [Hydrogenovibrio crunogenus]QBZ83514.1 Penicillin-binding protein activator LpoA [Hydrogenovibrio crunogenus]
MMMSLVYCIKQALSLFFLPNKLFGLLGRTVLLPLAIFAYSAVALSFDVPAKQTQQLDENSPPANLSLDEQIQLIDLEILLLKAELAHKNGQTDQVQTYLSELKTQAQGIELPSNIQDRMTVLQDYLNQSKPSDEASATFAFKPGRVLAVLPMSGPYSRAGQELYEGLKSSLKSMYPEEKLEVLDSNIYDSMFEAWEWIRLYQPSFIFGPLVKENVEALSALELSIPMLVFNEIKKPNALAKSFVPLSNKDAVDKLVDLVKEGHYQRIAVLTDESDSSKALMADFKNHWPEQESDYPVYIQEQPVVSNVDQALERAVNSRQSTARKSWLQRTVRSPIQFTERPRQDLELVISFLPYRLAMQVSPLLEYYHLNSIPHYWLPSQRPSVDEFAASIPFWQATSAILPVSYARSIKQNNKNTDQIGQIGIFYALGELAARTVIETTQKHSMVMNTQLGQLTLDENQNYHFYPEIYWLDTGVFEKLTD